MDVPNREFVLAGSLDELKAKGRLVLHGGHRPILVVYDRDQRSLLTHLTLYQPPPVNAIGP